MVTQSQLLQHYADLKLVGFLYNLCYGGFGYSNVFLQKLNERRAAAGLPALKANEEERSDPITIELFQELGSEIASGPFAKLALKWVPEEFLPHVYVDEYDGQESVRVDFAAAQNAYLHTFLRVWNETPEVCQILDLNHRIERMKAKEARYYDFQQAWRRTEKYD